MSALVTAAERSHSHALFTGTAFALAAGLMWGLVFIAPLLLPQYPAALLTLARLHGGGQLPEKYVIDGDGPGHEPTDAEVKRPRS